MAVQWAALARAAFFYDLANTFGMIGKAGRKRIMFLARFEIEWDIALRGPLVGAVA